MLDAVAASLVSSLLRKFLGKYIEGLDKQNLDVSNSDLKLTGLQLRKDVLDELALPVVMVAGKSNLPLHFPFI